LVAETEIIAVISGEASSESVFNFSIVEYDPVANAGVDLGSQVGEIYNGSTEDWSHSIEFDCGTIGKGQSYSWTAPSAGTVVIDTAGSMGYEGGEYDTIIGVERTNCSEAQECNDDNIDLNSKMTVSVSSGETIVLHAGGLDGEYGNLVLTLTHTPG
jgi:hypothetical protein